MSNPPGPPNRGLRFPLAVAALQVVAAPLLATRSCSGGLDAYVGLGALGVVVCLVVPYAKKPRVTPGVRAFRGAVISLLGWMLGFFVGGFALLCRLF